MERREATTKGFVPGNGPDCSRCLYRVKDSGRFECCLIKIESGIQILPRVEGNVCKSYELNLALRFRSTAIRARLFLYNIGPSLPKF